MKISQINYNQIADLLVASTELTSDDYAGGRVHILHHPELGDVAVIVGSDAGFLIQGSATGEGIHDFLRSVAACKF